jgi:hypothetical protein
MLLGMVGIHVAAADQAIRAILIAPDAKAADELAPLRTALTAAGVQVQDSLRGADVAVILHGPGGSAAAELREFLRAGQSAVVLGASPEAWPENPDFRRMYSAPPRRGSSPAVPR